MIFGFLVGIVLGILYVIPIWHCCRYFPTNQSIISCFIFTSSGLGTLLFGLVAISMLGVKNSTLNAKGYYDYAQVESFPDYMRTLSGITIGMVCLGSLLLLDFPTNLDFKDEMALKNKFRDKVGALMNIEFLNLGQE